MRRKIARRAVERARTLALRVVVAMPGALVFALAALAGACATTPGGGRADSIDIVMTDGTRTTLAAFAGRVVVVDVCASWASACNLNARVLDDVAAALPDQRLEVVTVLLDEEGPLGAAALDSYGSVLGVKHLVVLAGSRVRAGTSALRDAQLIPRIVILDATGAIVLDDSGGVVSVEGIVERVRPLLPAATP